MIQSIEKIKAWRRCVNLQVNTQFTMPSKSDFEAHCSHIEEEGNELLKAFKECNKEQILDGIGDLFWVTTSLNMLLGIPAHNHFYHKQLYDKGIKFDDLDDKMVKGYIKIINERMPSIQYILWNLEAGDTSWYIEDLEAMLWSLNAYVIALIEYLGVDIDRIISIIYDSNMTKLCTLDEANESVEALAKKDIKVRPYLSPVWGGFEKPPIGEQPRIYYLAEDNSRIRKPITFKEPVWSKY